MCSYLLSFVVFFFPWASSCSCEKMSSGEGPVERTERHSESFTRGCSELRAVPGEDNQESPREGQFFCCL